MKLLLVCLLAFAGVMLSGCLAQATHPINQYANSTCEEVLKAQSDCVYFAVLDSDEGASCQRQFQGLISAKCGEKNG